MNSDNIELETALDAFWNVAYAQGRERLEHDDEHGTAQKADDALRVVISKAIMEERERHSEDVISALSEVTKEMVAAAWNEGKRRGMRGLPPDFRAVLEAALAPSMTITPKPKRRPIREAVE